MSPNTPKLVCPYACNVNDNDVHSGKQFKIWDLIMHFMRHASHLDVLIKELQQYQSLPRNKCPIRGCGLGFSDGNLINHVGITHLGVLQPLWDTLDLRKDATMSKKILRIYAKCANNEEYHCSRDNCNAIFGNETEYKFHVARQHITVPLMSKFTSICRDGLQSGKKACVCGQEFTTQYSGGLHIGLTGCVDISIPDRPGNF